MAKPLDTGVLYRDDNLSRLTTIPSESVDLVYLDPPFFSNRLYEVVWGDEAEVRSFEDRWEGGMEVYVEWMRPRIVELQRVLKASGSLYLHCDPHASHYLKIMLDHVFGEGRLINEIVWKRTGAHSSARKYGPVHDLILYYGNGDTPTWNPQFLPYSREYVETKYRHVGSDGRRYQLDNLTGAGIRNGKSGEPWRGRDPTARGFHWKFGVDRLEELDAKGRIYWPRKTNGMPRYKRYLDEVRGIALQDVWVDIPPLNSQAKERLGYPTQKPEALLERILTASSNKGDVVLDPFCGCGTTVAVAERMERRWIGIDISATAIEVMRRRLLKEGATPIIENAPSTIRDLKDLKPFEFQNWIINAINGVHSARKVHDMGIDGYSFFTRDPVQVKQSEHVGRNVVDNFETAVRRVGRNAGFVIAFSFTRGAKEEAARTRSAGLDIRLITVAEVLLSVKRPGSAKKLGPQPATVAELPLPPIRKPKDLPSAKELIESDLDAATA